MWRAPGDSMRHPKQGADIAAAGRAAGRHPQTAQERSMKALPQAAFALYPAAPIGFPSEHRQEVPLAASSVRVFACRSDNSRRPGKDPKPHRTTAVLPEPDEKFAAATPGSRFQLLQRANGALAGNAMHVRSARPGPRPSEKAS